MLERKHSTRPAKTRLGLVEYQKRAESIAQVAHTPKVPVGSHMDAPLPLDGLKNNARVLPGSELSFNCVKVAKRDVANRR
jgi:hypothetical protein